VDSVLGDNGLQVAVSWAALISALLAIAGLLVVRRQLRQAERSLLGATSQFCYASMSALLEILIDKPYLRPYLYEGAPLPNEDDTDLRQQVLAVAAHYADFFDTILLQGRLGNVSVHEYMHVWKGFIQSMLRTSPTIRNYCLEHPSWYSPALAEFASKAQSIGTP
jgi:hypothetical protein